MNAADSRLPMSRRAVLRGAVAAPLVAGAVTAQTPVGDTLGEIPDAVGAVREEHDLRAVIVTIHDQHGPVFTQAWGDSEFGTPATEGMYFRTGAVAITYVAMVLLSLVDDGVLALDEPIETWIPGFPDGGAATPRMLAQMTAGYPDYVQSDHFVAEFYANPFGAWDAEELIAIGLDSPRTFAPGENWDYSHTNIAILANVIKSASGETLAYLMDERVFQPLGLHHTRATEFPAMPYPRLAAYSSERRDALNLDDNVPFYEETTSWNPSWTLPPGAVQVSTIADMASSFRKIGQGVGFSKSGIANLTNNDLLGFGSQLEGCPSCHTLDTTYSYGLGTVISNGWLLQNPLFGGYAATVATLPSHGYTIAAAVTFNEAAFDDDGNYANGNSSQTIARVCSELLVPEQSIPLG